jgi:hypothetical protein
MLEASDGGSDDEAVRLAESAESASDTEAEEKDREAADADAAAAAGGMANSLRELPAAVAASSAAANACWSMASSGDSESNGQVSRKHCGSGGEQKITEMTWRCETRKLGDENLLQHMTK